jgi:hypothetical protein
VTGRPLTSNQPMKQNFDLVVAGATPAGICAALAAARRGLSVALVDPLPQPGAMLSNGLCVIDTATPQAVSGIIKEFTRRVASYHAQHYADQPEFKFNIGAPRHGAADGLGFEPKTAARILNEMILETPTLRYFPRHELLGALMEGRRCVGVKARLIEGSGFDPRWAFRGDLPGISSPIIEFRGAAVVDSTYEGDIAASAGVPFRVGRDGRSRLEPHNGVIMSDYLTGRAVVDAGWLPETFLPGSTGEADPKVMSYNVRMVVKNYGRTEGPHRLQRPENYDPSVFRRWFTLKDGKTYIPNGKRFVNTMNGGNDLQGDLLSTYPNGTPAQRRQVLDALYSRARNYLYFLQTELDCGDWGLADDEFPENGGMPYCIYVREARRIVGLKTMTESDIHRWLPRAGDSIFDGIPGDRSRPTLQRDSIAIGDYDVDSRPCAPEPSTAYKSSGEGGFLLSSMRAPYQVPYGCLVPREIEGLIVTCAVSVSHVAICVVRMEPVWAQLGEAAGIAASLALASNQHFRDLDPSLVQAEMIASGSQLFYYRDVASNHPAFASIQRLSLRGSARGYPDWSYRPDRLITVRECVQMMVAAFALPPSITAHHFDDVPPTHPAFVAFETLYDHGARAGTHLVRFERLQKVYCDDNLGYLVYAHPEADATLSEVVRVAGFLAGLDPAEVFRRAEFLAPSSQWLSRGNAARLLDLLTNETNPVARIVETEGELSPAR